MTLRLVYIAGQNCQRFDGLMASRNIDPLDLPMDRFLSLVYWWWTEGADDQARQRFDARLWMPPKGEVPDKRSPWSAENETSAFKALKAGVSHVVG